MPLAAPPPCRPAVRLTMCSRSLSRAWTLALLIVLLLAAGCGRPLRTTITITHSLPDRPKATAYAFVPLKDQEENPENASYRQMIRSALAPYRFRETDNAHAGLLLSFSYGIDAVREPRSSGLLREGVSTEYRKGLWVFLYEKQGGEGEAGEVVYEGSVVCSGPLSLMGNVMPVMIRELFFDFPGESGSKRTVLLQP